MLYIKKKKKVKKIAQTLKGALVITAKIWHLPYSLDIVVFPKK